MSAGGGDDMDRIIHISSMYGAMSEAPYVKIKWGDQEVIMTPAEARAHAMRIVEVAANAEADGEFIRFLQTRLGIEKSKIPEIIRDFRAMRSCEGG